MAEALITKLTNLFRQDLDNKSNQATVQMASAWLKVEQDLLQDILDLATELSSEQQQLSLTKLNRLQRYVRLLAQLQKEMERFTGKTAAPIMQQLQATAAFSGIQQALTLIDATVSLSGGSAVDFTFDRLNVEAVQNIVAISSAGKPLGDLLQAAYPLAANGITNELITGIAKGQSPRVIARNIVNQGLSQGLNHILLVSRDQANRTFREGSRQQYQKAGILEYKRLAAHQTRTCFACLALDGQVFPTAELMPLHPQDRCLAPGQLVTTEAGQRPIEEVEQGERVLTHTGQYQKVVATKARQYTGLLIKLTHEDKTVVCTPEHKILTQRGWVEARNVRVDDILATF